MPNEITSRYSNNADRPDLVTCKECSANGDGTVLMFRDEIGNHDHTKHDAIAAPAGDASSMDGFSNLDAALRELWSKNGRDTDALLAVASAAQDLLDQLIPMTADALDLNIGNLTVLRRKLDADKAAKAANAGRYADWPDGVDLVKCNDCSRDTGTFLVPRAATHLHDRDVHAGVTGPTRKSEPRTLGSLALGQQLRVPPGM